MSDEEYDMLKKIDWKEVAVNAFRRTRKEIEAPRPLIVIVDNEEGIIDVYENAGECRPIRINIFEILSQLQQKENQKKKARDYIEKNVVDYIINYDSFKEDLLRILKEG